MLLQFLAGGGMGLLLGFLVGLSSSPVVASVVGAVSGGLLILLGLTSGKASTPASDPAIAWRITGFGILCTCSLLSGLWIRTQHVFTPPVKDQIKELTDAGFSPDDAHAWVAYTNSGLLIGSNLVAPEKGSRTAAGTSSSILFSTEGKTDACGLFTAERHKNQAEQINALQLEGGVWASYASYVAQLDPAGRDAALGSARKLFCR